MKKTLLWAMVSAFLLAFLLCGSVYAETSNGYEYEIVTYGNVKYAYLTGYTGTATTLTMPTKLGGYPVERVSNQVFINNTKIQSVTIPGTYAGIEPYAFKGCTALRTVTINEGLTYIGTNAFEGCEWLTSVNIPASVNRIDSNPFYNCKRLTSINTNASSLYLFQNNALYSADGKTLISVMTGTTGVFTIQEDVESIASYALAKCTSLTEVVIPETVTYIGSDAFHYCSGLTSIEIPESVSTIGQYAFRSCTNAAELLLCGKVTSMGAYAFADCGFIDVLIQDGITVLGDRMFMHSGNTKLETINIPSSVTSFGTGVLPKKKECVTVDCGSAALEWLIGLGYGPAGSSSAAYGYQIINHDWAPAEYEWSGDNSSVTATRICRNDESHQEQETVLTVASIQSPSDSLDGSAIYTSAAFEHEAFTEQSKTIALPALKNLDILLLPEDLETVEENAFVNLACEAVLVPDNCSVIGRHAFRDCKKLIYIQVPMNTEIAPDAFDGCNGVVIDRKESE